MVKRFKINAVLGEEIRQYVKNMLSDEYIFKSRKSSNKPITRVQAYRILSETATKIGLDEIGTHTLRKTFGYHHYQKFKDVAMLQKIFNHFSPEITLRYIGIEQAQIEDSYNNFIL